MDRRASLIKAEIGYCEGDACAQVVWHIIIWVVQLSKHDELAVALLVVVAAPVGGVPGTRHVDWQVAP